VSEQSFRREIGLAVVVFVFAMFIDDHLVCVDQVIGGMFDDVFDDRLKCSGEDEIVVVAEQYPVAVGPLEGVVGGCGNPAIFRSFVHVETRVGACREPCRLDTGAVGRAVVDHDAFPVCMALATDCREKSFEVRRVAVVNRQNYRELD